MLGYSDCTAVRTFGYLQNDFLFWVCVHSVRRDRRGCSEAVLSVCHQISLSFLCEVKEQTAGLQCDCGLHATSVRGGLTERFLNATEKRYGPTCSVSGCQLTKHRELMTRNKLIHFILKCLWHRVKRKDITATEQCGGCNMGNTFLDIQWQKPKCWVTDFPARGAARSCLPCSDCIWFPARRHSVIP